jgi:hypothetical protein
MPSSMFLLRSENQTQPVRMRIETDAAQHHTPDRRRVCRPSSGSVPRGVLRQGCGRRSRRRPRSSITSGLQIRTTTHSPPLADVPVCASFRIRELMSFVEPSVKGLLQYSGPSSISGLPALERRTGSGAALFYGDCARLLHTPLCHSLVWIRIQDAPKPHSQHQSYRRIAWTQLTLCGTVRCRAWVCRCYFTKGPHAQQ